MLLPLLLLCAPNPPALLEPAAAVAWARTSTAPILRRAEAFLVGGAPEQALGLLRDSKETPDRGRALRLEVEALIDTGAFIRAERLTRELEPIPGWTSYARFRRQEAQDLSLRETVVRIGSLMYALSLALLSFGGLRELLHVRRETLVSLGSALLGSAIILRAPSAIPPTAPIVFMAWAALCHAARATADRVEPGGRGRAIIVALVFSGSVGAALAGAAIFHPNH